MVTMAVVSVFVSVCAWILITESLVNAVRLRVSVH